MFQPLPTPDHRLFEELLKPGIEVIYWQHIFQYHTRRNCVWAACDASFKDGI